VSSIKKDCDVMIMVRHLVLKCLQFNILTQVRLKLKLNSENNTHRCTRKQYTLRSVMQKVKLQNCTHLKS
jgi:hypothetical protein